MSMNKQRRTGNILNAIFYDDSGYVTIYEIPHALIDTDKFIVSDNGVIKYRTGDEVLGDIGAQGAITLTTIGSSGPATLIGDVLNIPEYSAAGNPVSGSGTVNYIPKFTATSTIADSIIYENSGQIGIGSGTLSSKLNVFAGTDEGILISGSSTTGNAIRITNTTTGGKSWGVISTGSASAGGAGDLSIYNFSDSADGIYLTSDGKVGILNSNPATAFDVNGETKIRTINHAVSDTDKFIVSDGGLIKYRTGAELLSDIGGQPSITVGDLTESTSSVLTILGGLGAVVGSGTSIQVKLAGASQDGYLSSGDWNIFNSKQDQLNGTGFVKANGTTISYDNSTYALDSMVVHLAGNETITGDKLFDTGIYTKDGLVSHSTYTGYNGFSVSTNGSYNYLQLSTAGIFYEYELPLSSGHIALGTGSAGTLTYWFDADTLSYLDTSTYPDLTELSYLKGTTSNIQNQLDNIVGITTGNLTESTSSILTISGGTNAVVGAGTTIQVKQASASQSGYLSLTDWTTFNSKQPAGNYVTTDTTQTITGQKTFTTDIYTSASIRLTGNTKGLNNTANTHTWYSTSGTGWVSNTAITATAFYESSDIRLKNVIERNPNINLDVDVIKFTRKDAEGLRYGYSAQEVKEVAPELVGGDGFLSVNYLDLHTLKIAALEREIKELKAKLAN